MICDAHAHVSNTDYGNINKLIELHDELGIEKGILVPGGMLDVRKMTKYVTGQEQCTNPKPNNEILKDIIDKYKGRYYAFYCVDPNRGMDAVIEFEEAIKSGFSGLKLSPMSHQFSLTGKIAKELARVCGEMKVPFYTHVTFNPAANTAKIGVLATEFPNTNFIIGHLGFGPSDLEAFELAKKHSNIYLETSTANFLAISEAIRIAGASKIIYGSEYPLSHPEVETKKIENLHLCKDEYDMVMGKNILTLINAL